MELGALICTPLAWKCEQCPLKAKCQAYAAGRQAEFPVKKAKKAPAEVDLITLIVPKENQLLLCRDWQDGLMEGFMRLPQFTELKTEHLKDVYKRQVYEGGTALFCLRYLCDEYGFWTGYHAGCLYLCFIQ